MIYPDNPRDIHYTFFRGKRNCTISDRFSGRMYNIVSFSQDYRLNNLVNMFVINVAGSTVMILAFFLFWIPGTRKSRFLSFFREWGDETQQETEILNMLMSDGRIDPTVTDILSCHAARCSPIPNEGKSNSRFKRWLVMDHDYLIRACSESGKDYLVFQRSLICLQFCLTLLSVLFVHPINFQEDELYKSGYFSVSITNVQESTNVFIVHILVGMLSLPFILAMLASFGHNVMRYQDSRGCGVSSKTLFFTKLPLELRDPEALKSHIHERFSPHTSVKNVHINFSIPVLNTIEVDSATFRFVTLNLKKGFNQKLFTVKF